MNWDVKKIWPAAAMSIVAFTTMLNAADKMNGKNACPSKPYCGPDVGMGLNPSARPYTADACCCDQGEFIIHVAGLYWKSNQDGMEFAIQNNVANSQYQGVLVDADYINPNFKWNWGFKVGIGYNSIHDGWDLDLLWTHYRGKANRKIEAEPTDNRTLLPLWSAYAIPTPGTSQGILQASDIESSWRLRLDMIDLELGREFWTSKNLSLRPHIGLRGAWIMQDYDLTHLGGSWANAFSVFDYTNEVDLDNNFKGVGIRGGLNSEWVLSCGCGPCPSQWSIFGNVALSILYGRFEVNHDEFNRLAVNPFTKTEVLDTKDHFHASRAIADLALGIQWSTLFQDNRYGFDLTLAWEQHVFFNQNQMWRVVRVGDNITSVPTSTVGENVYHQRRGDLTTQGVTLSATITF